MFAGVHENVQHMMDRAGLMDTIGRENFFWSSDQAIVEAERRGCKFCEGVGRQASGVSEASAA